jgi:hypothetical protein
VFGAENVTIGGEFTPGAPDFVGPVEAPLSPAGSEFGTAAEFSGPTANTPLSPEGSEFGTNAEFANYQPPTFLEKVQAGLYTLQDKATQAFDKLVAKATAVVKDPAFLQKVVDKSITLALSPGQVSGQALLGVVTSSASEVAKNPTPVSGTGTTANRNALPAGENVVGHPSPFTPDSPEFVGPPAPRPALTISPATIDAAIAAVSNRTGINIGGIVDISKDPKNVSVDQINAVVPGSKNILSAGGTLVAGAVEFGKTGTINLTATDTGGYNNFTVNANAGTATAFAPAPVGGGDQLAGLTVSQLSNTTANPPAFKVDVNGIGVLTQDAAVTTGLNVQARQQQTARVQTQNAPKTGDWRVRLSLADGSRFLYNAANAGERNQAAYATSILTPLWNTNGVIFPYTPSISTSYRANYTTYDLTHSNYRGYFYQNSYVDAINIRAKFTAQDTAEANYLLAVIHFFRTVTKMFYGQDAERGSPPPLTFLTGLGDFQFNMHPCVVSNFEYEMPDDVDYIRAQVTSNNGTNLLAARNRSTNSPASPGGALTASLIRMINAKLTPGAEPGPVPLNTFGTASPDATYVPTKMNINLTLLPIQSRSQVSQLFSVKDFAAGNLLKGGFW